MGAFHWSDNPINRMKQSEQQPELVKIARECRDLSRFTVFGNCSCCAIAQVPAAFGAALCNSNSHTNARQSARSLCGSIQSGVGASGVFEVLQSADLPLSTLISTTCKLSKGRLISCRFCSLWNDCFRKITVQHTVFWQPVRHWSFSARAMRLTAWSSI